MCGAIPGQILDNTRKQAKEDMGSNMASVPVLASRFFP